MKNSETCERYEIEYQNADYYGEYKYADLLSKLSNLATKNAMEIGLLGRKVLMENMVGY